MSQSPKVLAAVHDPGGCSGLLPVLEALHAEGRLILYAGKFVQSRIGSLPFHPLSSELTAEEARTIFREHAAPILLTGTSWGSRSEQMLRNEAFAAGARSVVFQDYWYDYKMRWEGSTYPVSALADTVAAVDEGMRAEMIATGYPANRVVVTGHPRLEALSLEPHAKPEANGKILFLSEPPRSAYQGPAEAHPLLRVAEALRSMGRGYSISVKLHPKETLTPELSALVADLSKQGVPTAIVQDVVLPGGFPRFQYVLGYQTMGLFEATALGCRAFALPSIAMGPGLVAAMDYFGILRLGTDSASIRAALERAEREVPSIGPRLKGAKAAILALLA